MSVAAAPQTIGKRIAELRQQGGWTQQALAERLAISRVAVSHIEMDLTIPGERTVTLLASLFKCEPHELAAGTNYPQAKLERLPHEVAWYTPLEMDLLLMENDIRWVRLVNDNRLRDEITTKWLARLTVWEQRILNESDNNKMIAARKQLNSLVTRAQDAVK